MKTFKIVRIWKIQANNKWQAMELFRSMESAGRARDYLDAEFATDAKPKGWLATIMKQITG